MGAWSRPGEGRYFQGGAQVLRFWVSIEEFKKTWAKKKRGSLRFLSRVDVKELR